ncbi:type II secretion system F family protein [Halomonas elongata]|uniref:type II secretion system F family protein n=1 Tax=Halomonas elongata TaxID=2746 RepID=UPI00255ACE86|nr:type II secretion system F family protein [Halomonas elongata]MDL4860761.1 type II secretion system F family protein [Halomonas elongata]
MNVIDALSELDHKYEKLQLSNKKRAFFYKTLYRLVKNGVGVDKAVGEIFHAVADTPRRKKTPEAKFLTDIGASLSNGSKLSTALYDWVPYQEAVVIDAGEESGRILYALETVLYMMDKKSQLVKAVVSSLAYPVFLMLLGSVLLYIVNARLVPSMERILPGEEWTGAAAILLNVSNFISQYWLHLLVFIFVSIVAFIISLPRWRGRVRTWLDLHPPFSIYRMMYGATFLLLIASMMRAGITLSNSVRLLRKHANPWLDERLEKTALGLDMGNTLGVSLENSGHGFPDVMAVRFVKILGQYSGFEASLTDYGQSWLDESIDRIKRMASAIFVLALVLVAGLVGLTAGGMLSIQQNLMNSL